MIVDTDELFSNPDYFLLEFDFSDMTAVFVEMSRESYERSIFSDRRVSSVGQRRIKVGMQAILARMEQLQLARPQLCYIFHVAHCGSTLLARALDDERNIVYREPGALRQLAADAAGRGYSNEPPDFWNECLKLVTSQLAKRYAQSGPSIVKANVPVNFVLPHLLGLHEDARAILLYSKFEEYLLAVLKTDRHRQWVMRVSGELSATIEQVAGITAEERQSLTQSEMAACLWMVQMHLYGQVQNEFDSVVSLDSEVFFNHPADALRQAFDLFGQTKSDEEISEIVSSDLFQSYSKDPSIKFDNQVRLDQKNTLRNALSADIEEASRWLDMSAGRCEFPSELVRPLVNN